MAADTVVQVSFNCKLYVAGGTSTFPTYTSPITGIGAAGAPSWTEYSAVQDATVNLTLTESDVSIRGGGGFQLTEGALKAVSIEFSVPHVRGDPKREAFMNSWANRSIMGIAALDGPITDAVSKGFAMDMKVFSVTQEEPIAGTVKNNITLKPCYPGSDTSGNLNAGHLITGSTSGTLTLVNAF